MFPCELINNPVELMSSSTIFQISKSFIITPLKTVPVFFVRRIKDTNMLGTDVTQGMIAYASMAINYAEMRKISDALQILNDRVKSDE